MWCENKKVGCSGKNCSNVLLYPFWADKVGRNNGAWRSGLARMVRDHEVVGSNPTAPTLFREQALGNREQGIT
jgi:hypothetical protein